jgi:phosphoribosylanthranilate isomerase
MELKIKVCGMREPVNIVEVGDLSPDLMGFIFYPGSPRYAGETLKPHTLTALPDTIRKVGVFVNADYDNIKKTVTRYSLDYVQLHGDETAELCKRLKNIGFGIIKAFNIKEISGFDLCTKFENCADYFLFDAATLKHGGSGLKFDWKVLSGYTLDKPFFLSGGIGPEDVASILEIKNPSLYGIDLNSRFELKPGLKDVIKLRTIISAIRN